MRPITRALLIVAGMLMLAVSTQARNTTLLESGTCEGVSREFSWWSVIVVDGKGRPIESWGKDCQGEMWHKKYTIMPWPSDPFGGLMPTIYGVGDNGHDYAILTHYEGGNMTGCVGRDADGLFWKATAVNI